MPGPVFIAGADGSRALVEPTQNLFLHWLRIQPVNRVFPISFLRFRVGAEKTLVCA